HLNRETVLASVRASASHLRDGRPGCGPEPLSKMGNAAALRRELHQARALKISFLCFRADHCVLAGNSPGSHRWARVAGNASRHGDLEDSEVSTPKSCNCLTTRRA